MNQDQTDTHNPVSSQVEGIKNLVASDIAETAESKGPNESSQVEVVNVPNLTAAPNQVRVEQARTLLQNIEPGDHAQSTDQPSSGQPASSTASAPEPPTTTQAGDQPQASMTNGNANTEQTSNEQHEPGTTRATSRSEQVKTEIEHVPNSDRIKKVTMSSVTEREEVRKTTSHSILDNNADMLPNDISLRMHVSKADTLPRMSSGTTSSPGARVIDVRRKVSDTNTTENEGNTDSHTRHTPIRIPVKTILSPSPGPRNIRVMRNPDTVPYQIHEDMRKSYDEEISFLRGMLNRSASGYLPMDDHPKHMYNGRMGHSMFMNDYKDHDGKPDFWYNRALHTEEENRLLSSKIKDVRSAFRKNEHRMTKLQKERDDLYRRLHELEIREQNLVNHIEKVEDEHRNLARDYDVLRKWHNKRERHLQTVLNERTELIRINNILENELNAHYPRRDTLKKYSGDRLTSRI